MRTIPTAANQLHQYDQYSTSIYTEAAAAPPPTGPQKAPAHLPRSESRVLTTVLIDW
jgi:hypothetical protein